MVCCLSLSVCWHSVSTCLICSESRYCNSIADSLVRARLRTRSSLRERVSVSVLCVIVFSSVAFRCFFFLSFFLLLFLLFIIHAAFAKTRDSSISIIALCAVWLFLLCLFCGSQHEIKHGQRNETQLYVNYAKVFNDFERPSDVTFPNIRYVCMYLYVRMFHMCTMSFLLSCLSHFLLLLFLYNFFFFCFVCFGSDCHKRKLSMNSRRQSNSNNKKNRSQ